MAKMKYWNGTTWEILDAKDADTLDGKHYSDIKNEIEIKYATASGTNTYTVTISGITDYTEGLSVKIKFTNANTGASTLNINGLGTKEIRKSNGNPLSSGNIKAGQICHLVYTGSVFQLLGEGGEYGTATATQVLSGYTIGTENGIVSGTMTNNGAINYTLPINGTYTIPAGYHNGSGKVTQSISTKGAATYTPTTSDQIIAAGQYLSGAQTIKGDANLVAANIKSGISIFGVTGSYQTPVIKSIQRGSYTFDDTTSSVNITISAVDLNAAIVLFSHKYISGITTPYNVLIWARLTSPTTLELARAQAQGQQQVEWQVVEFNNVKSVQRGTVNMNSSATVTINAVDLSKSLCFASFKDSGSGGDMSNAFVAIKFNSTTQLSLSAYATISNTRSVHWQVIEFK